MGLRTDTNAAANANAGGVNEEVVETEIETLDGIDGATADAGVQVSDKGNPPAAQPAAGTAPKGKEVGANAAAGSNTTPPPAYVPDYKYKFTDAMGNKKELEFDEKLRVLIKDKAIEDHVRELYAKSAGLDFTKAHNLELKKQSDYATSQAKSLVQKYNPFENCLKNGDIETFIDKALEAFKIPQERYCEILFNKLNFENFPPEQQKMIRQQQELKSKYDSVQTEAEQYKQRLESQELGEVNYLLSNDPDIKAFDVKYKDVDIAAYIIGQQDIIQRQTGRYYTQAQILKMVAVQDKQFEAQQEEAYRQKYGIPAPAAPAAPGSAPSAGMPQAGAAPVVPPGTLLTKNVQTPAKNVIPSVPGSGAAPIEKDIETLDDF